MARSHGNARSMLMHNRTWIALRWLVLETFSQAAAGGLWWLTGGLTAVVVVGLMASTAAGEQSGTVGALHAGLGTWVAGAAGTLLTLVWTAGLLPGFLRPSTIAILVAKPLPRGALFAGRCVGVLSLVATQALIFLTATWLVVGLRSGAWELRFFLCLPS